jgi:cytochrome c551/c552
MNMTKYKFKISTISFLFFLFVSVFSISVTAQSVEEGEKLYNTNCTSCHMLDKKVIGPALRGINDKYSEELQAVILMQLLSMKSMTNLQ